MMFNFPFYPYYRSRYYANRSRDRYNSPTTSPPPSDYGVKESSPPSSSGKAKACTSDNSDKPVFELFGLKLYYDDILLVCLIFFLYNEGVKDDGLFIILILLLLS